MVQYKNGLRKDKNIKFYNKPYRWQVLMDELAYYLLADYHFSDSKEVYQQTY